MRNNDPWLFDMDGVLIDSKEAVHTAYEDAGVRVPNETSWGRPWQDWLVAECGGDAVMARKVHALKTEIYLERLRNLEVPLLPMADVARVLHAEGAPVYVITGAAAEVARIVVVDRLGLPESAIVGTGVPIGDRHVHMQKLAPNGGTYVDDLLAGGMPARKAGWRFVWSPS